MNRKEVVLEGDTLMQLEYFQNTTNSAFMVTTQSNIGFIIYETLNINCDIKSVLFHK